MTVWTRRFNLHREDALEGRRLVSVTPAIPCSWSRLMIAAKMGTSILSHSGP